MGPGAPASQCLSESGQELVSSIIAPSPYPPSNPPSLTVFNWAHSEVTFTELNIAVSSPSSASKAWLHHVPKLCGHPCFHTFWGCFPWFWLRSLVPIKGNLVATAFRQNAFTFFFFWKQPFLFLNDSVRWMNRLVFFPPVCHGGTWLGCRGLTSTSSSAFGRNWNDRPYCLPDLTNATVAGWKKIPAASLPKSGDC